MHKFTIIGVTLATGGLATGIAMFGIACDELNKLRDENRALLDELRRLRAERETG